MSGRRRGEGDAGKTQRDAERVSEKPGVRREGEKEMDSAGESGLESG